MPVDYEALSRTLGEAFRAIEEMMATMGRRGRDLFNHRLIEEIDNEATPAALKVAWNRVIAELTAAAGE